MSELLDSYVASLPERCQSCPVLRGFVATAESYERNADIIYGPLIRAIENGVVDNPEANDFVQDTYSTLLAMTTDGELYATKMVAVLASIGDDCPTPKRGAPEFATARWKIEAFLRREKICRNPMLMLALEQV